MKRLCKSSVALLRNFSRTKNLRISHTKQKEDSFILPALSYSPSQHCSVPTGNPQTNSPYQESKNTVNEQLLQPAGHCTKDSLQFHPTQSGKTETCRDGKEQGRKARSTSSHTETAITVHRDLLSIFATVKKNDRHSCHRLPPPRAPADFTSFHAQALTFTNVNHLPSSPISPRLPCWSQEPCWQPVQVSAAVECKTPTETPLTDSHHYAPIHQLRTCAVLARHLSSNSTAMRMARERLCHHEKTHQWLGPEMLAGLDQALSSVTAYDHTQ